MWASIPYIVEPQKIGTAFGICVSIQNIGLAIGPLIITAIRKINPPKEKTEYFWVMGFLIVISIIGFIVALILLYNDKKYMNNVLN